MIFAKRNTFVFENTSYNHLEPEPWQGARRRNYSVDFRFTYASNRRTQTQLHNYSVGARPGPGNRIVKRRNYSAIIPRWNLGERLDPPPVRTYPHFLISRSSKNITYRRSFL